MNDIKMKDYSPAQKEENTIIENKENDNEKNELDIKTEDNIKNIKEKNTKPKRNPIERTIDETLHGIQNL